eukprot:SAG31_NODE_921_length_10984_cov_2.779329_6_plen_79_part_00
MVSPALALRSGLAALGAAVGAAVGRARRAGEVVAEAEDGVGHAGARGARRLQAAERAADEQRHGSEGGEAEAHRRGGG